MLSLFFDVIVFVNGRVEIIWIRVELRSFFLDSNIEFRRNWYWVVVIVLCIFKDSLFIGSEYFCVKLFD